MILVKSEYENIISYEKLCDYLNSDDFIQKYTYSNRFKIS